MRIALLLVIGWEQNTIARIGRNCGISAFDETIDLLQMGDFCR